jgi:hypothetical protein
MSPRDHLDSVRDRVGAVAISSSPKWFKLPRSAVSPIQQIIIPPPPPSHSCLLRSGLNFSTLKLEKRKVLLFIDGIQLVSLSASRGQIDPACPLNGLHNAPGIPSMLK